MIPVNEPLITKSDARSVYDSIKKGWISSAGPQVKIFETKFKKMIKKKILFTSFKWNCSS